MKVSEILRECFSLVFIMKKYVVCQCLVLAFVVLATSNLFSSIYCNSSGDPLGGDIVSDPDSETLAGGETQSKDIKTKVRDMTSE